MRVITFSRTFPATHPRKGDSTYFPEKILRSLGLANSYIWEQKFRWLNDFALGLETPKYHTIRAGNRWSVGEWFSPRVWSEKPYSSKQIEFAPPIQIKKIYSFQYAPDYDRFWIDGIEITDHATLERLAMNDGLTYEEMIHWFNAHPKKSQELFKGQILCWNESITY